MLLLKLEAAVLDIASETGVWIFHRLAPTSLPTFQKFELTVGEATLELTGNEIANLFQIMLDKADA